MLVGRECVLSCQSKRMLKLLGEFFVIRPATCKKGRPPSRHSLYSLPLGTLLRVSYNRILGNRVGEMGFAPPNISKGADANENANGSPWLSGCC